MLEIKHLGDCSEYVELVTNWMWKEWGNKENYKRYETIVKHSLKKDNLPQTFVAFMGEEPVGTVGLWRCDLMSRQDLYPWLASLYVIPQYRGKGIGTELQKFLIKYSKDLGYDEIFLYTDLDDYYEKTGWKFVDTSVTDSMEEVKIYSMKE